MPNKWIEINVAGRKEYVEYIKGEDLTLNRLLDAGWQIACNVEVDIKKIKPRRYYIV